MYVNIFSDDESEEAKEVVWQGRFVATSDNEVESHCEQCKEYIAPSAKEVLCLECMTTQCGNCDDHTQCEECEYRTCAG